MGTLAWGGASATLAVVAWLVVGRPLRLFLEDRAAEAARSRFRREREWLEARFLTALGRTNPLERLRWEEARWHNQVLWARDRQTRVFLALIALDFEATPSADPDPYSEPAGRHATALFEFRRGVWVAEGKWLDATRPDEAVLRNRRFELVLTFPRRGS